MTPDGNPDYSSQRLTLTAFRFNARKKGENAHGVSLIFTSVPA